MKEVDESFSTESLECLTQEIIRFAVGSLRIGGCGEFLHFLVYFRHGSVFLSHYSETSVMVSWMVVGYPEACRARGLGM